MTSPLRRKRRTTRPNSKAPKATNAAAVAGVALALLTSSARLGASELQWRASRDAVASPQTAAPVRLTQDGAVRPASDEESRSVVVNRGDRLAQNSAAFDPFEEDVPMPDAAAPAAAGQFDPFEADDAAPIVDEAESAIEAPAVEAPVIDAPPAIDDVQDAFDEPPAADEGPTAAQELEAAQEAIDRELMRREVESGADRELVTSESDAAEDNQLEVVPEMQDEIVPPSGEDVQDEVRAEDALDYELQYGEGLPIPELTPEQIAERRRQIEQERIEHDRECEILYDQVRRDTIKTISLDITLQGTPGEDYPFECVGRHPTFEPRAWSQTVYTWKASGLCHKPLYFEQVQLERYGHSWGPVLQPIMSGAHFFGTVPILPYKMGLQTPQECVYTLGYYRPGSCAPYMITQPGFTWRAAAFQTGVATGISAVVP